MATPKIKFNRLLDSSGKKPFSIKQKKYLPNNYYTYDKTSELRETLRELLGDDFGSLPSPFDVGKRIRSKAKEISDKRNESGISPPSSVFYNNESINLEKRLKPENINNEQVLTTLRERIGATSEKVVVEIPIAIEGYSFSYNPNLESCITIFSPGFENNNCIVFSIEKYIRYLKFF